MNETNDVSQVELEAAAFRHLVEHLRRRADVQNIDLMILAGFCRNCLAKWYSAAAQERGVNLEYSEAQERIYGMPYDVWKRQFQTEASPEKLAAMAQIQREQS